MEEDRAEIVIAGADCIGKFGGPISLSLSLSQGHEYNSEKNKTRPEKRD